MAVGATYPPDVAGRFVQFLTHHDISVLTVSARDIITAAEVGTLPGDLVLDFAAAVAGDAPDAQAVLLPDTALHTVDLLDALEERVGKPVLTANQVSIWQGLRLAGADVERPGLGTLFTDGVTAWVTLASTSPRSSRSADGPPRRSSRTGSARRSCAARSRPAPSSARWSWRRGSG